MLESKHYRETFWVGRKSFALRKIVETYDSPDYRETKTQLLHPEFGVAVREKDFRFDPPASSAAVTKAAHH